MSLLMCTVLYVQDSVLNNMEKKVITITLMWTKRSDLRKVFPIFLIETGINFKTYAPS